MKLRPITRSFAATLEAYNLKNPKPLLATMETVAFQHNDSFGPKLEAVLSKYKDMVDSGANHKAIKSEEGLRTELQGLIKSRLGMTVKLVTDKYLAAVLPNIYVPHNAVIKDNTRWIFEKYDEIGAQDKLNKIENRTVIGAVNTETAKISGWFADQELPVFMNMVSLFKTYKLSVPEVTAIILHELGHAFEAVVYTSNVNTTNQILADLVRYISDNDRGGDINYVYSKVKLIDPKASREIAEGLLSKDKTVYSVSTYRLLVGTSKSLMSASVYDRTTFEALADNFASRFGYGAFLAQGLEKFEKLGSEYERERQIYENSVVAMLYCGFLSVISTMAGLAILSSNAGLGMICAFCAWFFGFIFYAIMKAYRGSHKNLTYDNIRDRYMRIRSQLVELIKDPEISVEVRKTTLDQITVMDDMISRKKVFDNPLTNLLAKVFPSDRFALENIAAQQEMERMISNDLFVTGHKLAIFGKK